MEDMWQGLIEEFSSQVEMRKAKQGAHVQYMRRQLVQAWDRAQVQVSHHAEIAAVAEIQQELVAHLSQGQLTIQTNLQHRGKFVQLGADASNRRTRRLQQRAKTRSSSFGCELRRQLVAARRKEPLWTIQAEA